MYRIPLYLESPRKFLYSRQPRYTDPGKLPLTFYTISSKHKLKPLRDFTDIDLSLLNAVSFNHYIHSVIHKPIPLTFTR